MFKNMLVYKLEEPFTLDLMAFNEMLKQKSVTPCLTQEMKSLGWIELDNHSDEFAIQINKAIFFCLCVERKLLPNSVINTAIKARIKKLNLKHVSRSEHKELHEYVMNKLLPKALEERSYIFAYIDLEKNRLVVDASSTKKASSVTSHLRKTLGSLPIVPLTPENSVTATLTHWALHGIQSDVLSMLDEIELKELKDEGGNAKFKGIALDSKEVQDPLKEGWQVPKLSLEYDESIQFKLDATFILKNIKYIENFHDQIDSEDDPKLQWQANFYLMIDYHRRVLTALLDLCNKY